MSCKELSIGEVTLFICNPHAAMEAMLIAESDRQWFEHERELDLERELELNQETEMMTPMFIPAEAVMDWDAYQGSTV